MNMNDVLKNRLKEERLRLGLNQNELALKLGTTNRSISNYEKGDREPNIDMLNKLADVFDCSVDYLVGRSPHRDYSIEKMNIDGTDYYVGIKKEAMNKLTPEQKLELAKELINDTVK